MNVKKVALASCDWKNASNLIQDLVKVLPALGVYAYDINTGGDSFNLAVSSEPLTQVWGLDAVIGKKNPTLDAVQRGDVAGRMRDKYMWIAGVLGESTDVEQWADEWLRFFDNEITDKLRQEFRGVILEIAGLRGAPSILPQDEREKRSVHETLKISEASKDALFSANNLARKYNSLMWWGVLAAWIAASVAVAGAVVSIKGCPHKAQPAAHNQTDRLTKGEIHVS